mgnify:FL=1
MSRPFVMRQRLRFSDCDPAGIAYYPRYLALCDGVIEEWTEAVVGVSRLKLHFELEWGLPTVTLQAEFAAVSRLGDQLDFTLRVSELGQSSIGLVMDVACGGEPRFRVTYKQVLVDMKSMRSVPWPDDWRARIAETMA